MRDRAHRHGRIRESGGQMTAITELARAKVNLTLRVRGRRCDGYHELESLIVFADQGDRVQLGPGGPVGVHVSGPFAAMIAGPNLVATALARLAVAEPRLALGSVTLDKRLPVAAGIGGGSADAAALLRAVRRANPTLAGDVDWAGIAAALSADVPVCLESEPALVWGVGERIEAVPDLPRLPAVLVNPLVPVPPDKTARVFATLGAPPVAAGASPPQVSPTRLATMAALLDFMRAEGNDLLAPATAVVPEIADVRAALASLPGCLFTGLSGAGPTCYGVFSSAEETASAAASLRRREPGWWVAAAILGG
jgi:4-diphosphocytidyl-2-C-methyl-D-erythritol kinase